MTQENNHDDWQQPPYQQQQPGYPPQLPIANQPQPYPPQQPFSQPPYPPQQPYTSQPQSYQQPMPSPPGAKSATTAGLLGLFLGTFGVHDFFLGYKTTGIIHVCLGGVGLLCVIFGPILAASMALSLSRVGLAAFLLTGMPAIGSIAISASGAWGVVSGIMCLTKSGQYRQDANGIPLY